MIELPPLRSLQVFEAVMRCGSLTAAAEDLNVSGGAISQQIRILEDALGVRLLERQGRSLRETSWGRIYYQHIKAGFEELRAGQALLSKARTRSDLTVSALPSLAIRWLRPLLQGWQFDHPGSNILLIGTDEEADFSTGGIDFRITYGRGVRGFEHYTELFVDWIVPACAPLLLNGREILAASEILQGPLLHIEWDVSQQPPPSWDDWAQSVGVPPRSSGGLAFSLSSTAIDAAVNGGGFVLGQLSMIQDDIVNGRLITPVDHRLAMPQPYYLAWNRSVMDTQLGPAFKRFLQKAAHRLAEANGLLGSQ